MSSRTISASDVELQPSRTPSYGRAASAPPKEALAEGRLGSVANLVYPGSSGDRRRYHIVRYAPIVIVGIWLMLPQRTPPGNGASPNECADLILYSIFFRCIYSAIAVAMALYSYRLVVESVGWSTFTAAVAVGAGVETALFLFLESKRSHMTKDQFQVLEPVTLAASAVVVFVVGALPGFRFQPGPDRTAFFRDYKYTSLGIVIIVLSYYYSQVFAGLFDDVDNAELRYRVLLRIAFQLVFLVLKSAMAICTEKLSHLAGRQLLGFMFGFVVDLMFLVFYKNLFPEFVDTVELFAAFQVTSFFAIMGEYPLRMTQWYFRFRNRQRVRNKVLRWLINEQTDYGQWVRTLTVDFFFRTIAEIQSFLVAVLFITFLRFGWNQGFFPYAGDDLPKEDYERAMVFLAVSLAFEIVIVIFVRYFATRVIQKFEEETEDSSSRPREAFTLGSRIIRPLGMQIALILASAHVQQDLFVSQHSLTFC